MMQWICGGGDIYTCDPTEIRVSSQDIHLTLQVQSNLSSFTTRSTHLSFHTTTPMIEPVEGEFAQPSIFTNAQEAALENEDVELTDVVSRTQNFALSPSSTLGNQSNDPSVIIRSHDLEKGSNARVVVHFEAGEDPKLWSKGRKW